MNTLLVYATYSGSTLEVSNYIAEEFDKQGKNLTIKEARDTNPEIFNDYDLIILGSPTWGEGETHELFKRLIEKSSGKTFPDKPFAVFALGDTSYQHFCTAAETLEKFAKELKGKLLTKSLKINNFYFNQHEEIPKITEWTQKILADFA